MSLENEDPLDQIGQNEHQEIGRDLQCNHWQGREDRTQRLRNQISAKKHADRQQQILTEASQFRLCSTRSKSNLEDPNLIKQIIVGHGYDTSEKNGPPEAPSSFLVENNFVQKPKERRINDK